MAEQGLRVLAVATKTTDSPDAGPYEDLTFLGLVGMADPPRSDVAEAIGRCRDAGMKVVMVTGDHAATARSIARQVGLIERDDQEVIEGRQIRPVKELSDDERRRFAEARVFARVSPEQKLHLIDIHQQAGAVVAMTGDGVNDAPALKKADIGVAMGIRGSQVAREAADMILKDDAFSSIVVAVEEGRVIFNNIRKFVVYLLSANASEILTVFVASLLNWPLPLLPLQILFLNIVTDAFPALALGVGRGGEGIMKQPPRNPKEAHPDERTLVEHLRLRRPDHRPCAREPLDRHIRAAEWMPRKAVTVSFLTLAFAQLWHVFNMRDPDSGLVHNEVTANPYVWAALAFCTLLLLGAVYLPGISTVLDLSGPGLARLGGHPRHEPRPADRRASRQNHPRAALLTASSRRRLKQNAAAAPFPREFFVSHFGLSCKRVTDLHRGIPDMQNRHIMVDEKSILDDRDEWLLPPQIVNVSHAHGSTADAMLLADRQTQRITRRAREPRRAGQDGKLPFLCLDPKLTQCGHRCGRAARIVIALDADALRIDHSLESLQIPAVESRRQKGHNR